MDALPNSRGHQSLIIIADLYSYFDTFWKISEKCLREGCFFLIHTKFQHGLAGRPEIEGSGEQGKFQRPGSRLNPVGLDAQPGSRHFRSYNYYHFEADAQISKLDFLPPVLQVHPEILWDP